jgi:hypothetical protein
MFDTIFFRDGKDECKYRLINEFLWNPVWCFGCGIIGILHSFSGKYTLIEIYHSVTIGLKALYSGFDFFPPVFIFDFFVWVYQLSLFNLLAFDFMNVVNFSQQSRIDSMISKMAVKKNTSLIYRFTSPSNKNIRVG